jgi:hypothetical protein
MGFLAEFLDFQNNYPNYVSNTYRRHDNKKPLQTNRPMWPYGVPLWFLPFFSHFTFSCNGRVKHSFKLSLTWQLAFFRHVFLRWLCVVCSILPSTLILAFAGSIPDGVIVIFNWHNPSVRTIALWLTQLLTEMSSRNISWGVKAAGALGWQSYHLHVSTVLKSGSLNLLEPSGPVQACNWTALRFLFLAVYRYLVGPFVPLRTL